jgi:hypothetical protein
MSRRHRVTTALTSDPAAGLPVYWTALFVVLLLALLAGAWMMVPDFGLLATDPMITP